MNTRKKKSAVYKYNYYDETGKRRCKSFSAPTMREAKLKAMDWELNRPKKKGSSMTVSEAVEGYIESRRVVLSPATIRGYESIKKTRIDPMIGDMTDPTSDDVQTWINRMTLDDVSPKTISNCYGLLKSATKKEYDVALPQKEKYIGHTPSDDEVGKLIEYTKRMKDHDLYHSILLSAFGTLRRSELCAITDQDIDGNFITIDKAKVKTPDGGWVIKGNKTTESKRVIEFPPFVIDEIKDIKGEIIKCNPDALHHRFRRAIKYSKAKPFRFHDLRGYSVSVMHSLGIPDAYIRQRGGWKTDYVMKQAYIKAMEEETLKKNKIMFRHFDKVKQKVKQNTLKPA